MTATSHLSKRPSARGRTIAWLQIRDAKTAQLAAETRASRRSKWAISRWFYALGRAVRGRG
jgi:hypothetical protein